MMCKEGDVLGLWEKREEMLEDVDCMKVVMGLLKVWLWWCGSVAGAMEEGMRRERERLFTLAVIGGMVRFECLWMCVAEWCEC